MAEVRLAGITKRFGAETAVDGLDLTLADGEFVALLGPTGAGKTTTLRLVAGLEQAESGSVSIGGRVVDREPPAMRDVTFVFQQYSLYPHLSVYDNLAFPLRSPARRLPEDTIRKTVTEIATLLRIDDKLQNRATRLSGGQMQRVAIGRALVRRPAVSLMDEPLSSLDARLRADLRLEMRRIHAELGATILWVTHDQTEAMTMADRIGVLDRGRLVQIGTPREIYEKPADIHVAARLGHPAINLVDVAALPVEGVEPGTRTVGARAEHIRLTRVAGEAARGRVTWIEHLGDQNRVHVRHAAGELVTHIDPDDDLVVDDPVDVTLVRPLCFDGSGRRLGA
jgi:multiple sugar transport system ATP-binding protein